MNKSQSHNALIDTNDAKQDIKKADNQPYEKRKTFKTLEKEFGMIINKNKSNTTTVTPAKVNPKPKKIV